MFNERQLTQCFSDHQKRFGGLKEDYFAVLYLAKRFALSQEEALKWVTFGGFDYGIDAYYVDGTSGNLYIYQFKWSVSVVQMGQSIDRLVDSGIDAIFGNQPAELRRNDIINRLRADVRERQSEIRRVFFFFVSNGTMPNRGENAVLDSRLEDLERVSAGKLRSFFRTDIEIIIRVNDDAAPPPQFRFSLQWTGNSNYKLETGESLSVGFASLVDLVTMYEKMGLRLFQKNIRAGLTWDTPPNRALRATFQEIASGKTNPKVFVFRHNGVSIEVSDFIDAGQTAAITEPRILNGAQTIVTLHRLMFPKKGNPPDATELERLSHIRVLAKIIFGSSEQFVTDVTIANNKQNPVKPWNLRASDRYQIDLEQRFKEEVRLHYDRLQNSYVSRGENEWEDEGIQSGRVIEIEKLGLALTAARGEIDKMSRMPEVWEQEAAYREIFDPRFVEDDYDIRRIVLAYKVQFCLRSLVADIASRGEKKYGFISKGRNLVWALAIQALLNDNKIHELLEDYGVDLKAGPDFRERLTKVATARIAPILNQAISLPIYRDQLKAEKFSFLKSNAFFKVCRNMGSDKFDWAFKKL